MRSSSFAELERFIDLPVRTYSSGMHMRLGFAIAVHVDADILLLDEVFAVGDEAFQRKCIGKILAFKERGGTVCFVSHSAPAVERLCERAMLLSQGEVEYDGPSSEAHQAATTSAGARGEPGGGWRRAARVGERRGSSARASSSSAGTEEPREAGSSPASRS